MIVLRLKDSLTIFIAQHCQINKSIDKNKIHYSKRKVKYTNDEKNGDSIIIMHKSHSMRIFFIAIDLKIILNGLAHFKIIHFYLIS